jgi:hypothetical protein
VLSKIGQNYKGIFMSQMERAAPDTAVKLNGNSITFEKPGYTSLTADAELNLAKIRGELEIRSAYGLATVARLNPRAQILDRLDSVTTGFKDLSAYVQEITSTLTPSDFDRPLVIGIPVAGFGGQEYGRIRGLVEELSKDSAVISGLVQVLVFVNRPPGVVPDLTDRLLREAALEFNIPVSVVTGEVPALLGRTDGPLMDGIDPSKSSNVPISFIRDILSLSVMRLWAMNTKAEQPPIYLQMDIDFEGFAKGGLSEIINRFAANSRLMFLQGTSQFDDRNFPTAAVPVLRAGDDLMRELPLGIKRRLSNSELPPGSNIQAIFGEAIQRGVQVPQAERLESIARKGGYGLLRMPEDELDANIRTAALANEFSGVECCEETIFKWNSRRAILALGCYGKPPISQWAVEFRAIDVARDVNRVRSVYEDLIARRKNLNSAEGMLQMINQSLAHFPVPERIQGIYNTAEELVREALARCGIEASGLFAQALGSGLVVIQVKSISLKEVM